MAVQITPATDSNCTDDLTQKQAFGLGVIRALLTRQGFPPTHYEIADALGVSRPTALQLIVILERKGYILREPGVGRSLRLTGKELPYQTQKGRTAK